MSDITGDAFVVYAAETLPNAIEHVGKTSSQEQIGKAIAIADETGVKIADDNDDAKTFIGIVKAASGEAQVGFGSARMINDVVTGADPTVAPYFTGNVTIPKGKALTIERNCISYVFIADSDKTTVKAGDLIAPAGTPAAAGATDAEKLAAAEAAGRFKVVDDIEDAVGRAYSSANSNGVIRAYIRAI